MAPRPKQTVRAEVWASLERERVSRFPGAAGRIPNFAGSKRACERLTAHPAWVKAQAIKANPDAPQTHARRLALEQGKVLVMAVPRLRDEHPFRLLDPAKMTSQTRREAATIKGALKHGEVMDVEQVPPIDLVLTGSVATNLSGGRLGKGGGYSDLEFALLTQTARISPYTTIATTVHPLQVLQEHLLATAHDIPVDLVVTPRATIEVESVVPRPQGILWDHLQPPQIHEIPVLERFGYAG